MLNAFFLDNKIANSWCHGGHVRECGGVGLGYHSPACSESMGDESGVRNTGERQKQWDESGSGDPSTLSTQAFNPPF